MFGRQARVNRGDLSALANDVERAPFMLKRRPKFRLVGHTQRIAQTINIAQRPGTAFSYNDGVLPVRAMLHQDGANTHIPQHETVRATE